MSEGENQSEANSQSAQTPPDVLSSTLSQMYAHCAAADADAALDLVFDLMGNALAAADFATCNAALRQVEPERLDITTALGFLSTTCGVRKSLLPDRAQYLARVRALLIEQGVKNADQLLNRAQSVDWLLQGLT